MSCDPPEKLATDRRSALALVWAVACGLLYARMVVVERLPGLARWLP